MNTEKLKELCKSWDDHAEGLDPNPDTFRNRTTEFLEWAATAATYRQCSHELMQLIKGLA